MQCFGVGATVTTAGGGVSVGSGVTVGIIVGVGKMRLGANVGDSWTTAELCLRLNV